MSTHFESLDSLVNFYSSCGVRKVFIKTLAPNDNSKNQVYFGPGFGALTLFPLGEISALNETASPIFKAPMPLDWINDGGTLSESQNSQVILYPQYPETRLSGFLKGVDRGHLGSIRELMTSRLPGRVLFLGVHESGRTIASVFHPESAVANAYRAAEQNLDQATQIFRELVVPAFLGVTETPKQTLLRELSRISGLGWIDSKRLSASGNVLPCTAPQCGGYTLEAELGITPNGRSEPDFLGWEIKQHTGNVLTLMTPEPTGGFYVDEGVDRFVRTYGYPDKLGRPDRLNFGGTHFCNTRHALTQLTMVIEGYDATANKIVDPSGGIALVSDTGDRAAFWAFKGVLEHWNRKHRNAAYIPGEHRTTPRNQYRYGSTVLLGEGTDPLKLISAVHSGEIYYDPAIKLENASTARPSIKRRSQFRVKLKNLTSLYDRLTEHEV
ncbi:hypothetical protein PIN31009_02996 [Pandoraea iniqua]|uniref:MvaI/BcnI family restriction endonuclease n=1 Tax=Pandoraea iniqua TaxID=2508288 RepID=UPI00123FB644|nr:MvaI/BcnI family restriction endonuclease [Pandoraea iniqua]VVE18301.1 hypothetical protein PIN31009_02996 [Pandoraea iniqua]